MENTTTNCAFLELEAAELRPGDTVRGTLYLVITSGVTVDYVAVNIRGFERIRWQDSVPDQRAIEHNRLVRDIQQRQQELTRSIVGPRFPAEDSTDLPRDEIHDMTVLLGLQLSSQLSSTNQPDMSNTILPETVIVDRFSNSTLYSSTTQLSGAGIMAGYFSFPFALKLPEGMPGSFAYTEDTTSATLGYEIEGMVRVVGGPIKTDISHTAQLTVIKPPLQMQRVSCAVEAEVDTCGWYSHGKVKMECYSDKNIYTAGETMKIVSNIDNQTTKDINGFKVELISVLTLRAGPHVKTIELVQGSGFWQAGLPSKQSITGIDVSIDIPENAKQQTFGQKLTHYYYVKLTGAIDWANDAECRVPIGIFEPQPDKGVVAVKKVFKKAKVAERVNANLPELEDPDQGIDFNLFSNLKTM